MNATAYKIARRFVQELRNVYLDDEQIAEVNRRNAAETNPLICHSHDFCDANQAMIDAAGSPFVNTDVQNALINEAWALAKSWGFTDPVEKAACKKCGEQVDVAEMDYREWCEDCVYLNDQQAE